jgi:alcohol dehydrogenase
LAVYDAPNKPFEIRRFPVRAPRAGEVLVKIRMSTICRSDIHSYLGHRPNPCPGVLGHEIIGTIVALGGGVTHDMRGAPLAVGERITWSEYFIPGASYQTDVLDLPQKAPGVDKYGHMAVTTDPHHHGGFGEYCYILPKSWILKLPESLATRRPRRSTAASPRWFASPSARKSAWANRSSYRAWGFWACTARHWRRRAARAS